MAAVLAACGTTPVEPAPELTVRPQPVPIPDETLPPTIRPEATARQRIIDIAMQEWLRWGGQVVTVAKGRACVTESPLPPPPEYLAAKAAADSGVSALAESLSPCLNYPDGTGMEATEDGCELAERYWHILGRSPDCQQITTPRWAWSAAFISWVIRQAGLSNDQFLTGEAHSMYVTDARDGILPAPAFRVEPFPAMPVPGDMICSTRDTAAGVSSIYQINFTSTPMHCDIVIEADPAGHVVKAIGGNVQQSVSMSVIHWEDLASVPPQPTPLRGPPATIQFISDTGQYGEASPEQVIPSPTRPWLLVMRNQLN